MVKEHILIEMANTYSVSKKSIEPKGFHFDVELGAWVSNTSGELLIHSDKQPPSTKKMDIETGEDQKGT